LPITAIRLGSDGFDCVRGRGAATPALTKGRTATTSNISSGSITFDSDIDPFMSVETAADRGQPINPMQLSEMPNAKLSGLFTSGYLHQRCVHPVFFSIKQKWGGALVKIDQSLRCTREWR